MYHNLTCRKPPKIDHAKIFISNVLLIFFIINFLLLCLLVCKPLRNIIYLITPYAGLLFNLIRNPRGYQDIGTWPFPDSFHFAKSRTNPKRHQDWKIQTSSTKYWNRPRLSFLYSINLELQSENTGYHKPSTNPWDGEFLYRITSYRMPKTICNTTLMNLCSNLESSHDSLKNRNLKKIFPIPRKPNIPKKI